MRAPTTDFTKTGDLGGRKVTMEFDKNSLAFLQSTLIDLYSDPILAVVREYSSNAYDSHIEAGQTRPIEVTTPTHLSPYFKVKDYGVGLSMEDIELIYSKYGASTKRESDTQVGMLGLGSKSALTYTNQFNVRSVKNGKEIYVSVSRAVDGGGEMSILAETDTNEHNGVEIIIPAVAGSAFDDKAKQFFRFWTPGTVLLNGKEPEHIDLLKVTDRVHLSDLTVDRYGYRTSQTSHVVMGNVAYEIDWKQLSASAYPYDLENLVIFVDIGEVNFAPSREQLMYTSTTKRTLEQAAKDYQDNLLAAMQRDIDSQPSYTDALTAAHRWKKLFRSVNINSFKYNGIELPSTFRFDFEYSRNRYSNKGQYSAGELDRQWSYISNKDVILIIGCSDDKISSYRKAQIKKWAEDNGLNSYGNFLICNTLPGSPWTDNLKTYNWDDIKATKFNKAPAGTKKRVVTWDAYIDGVPTEVTSFDLSKELVYAGKVEIRDQGYDVSRLFNQSQVALLNVNRFDKFKAAYPTAVDYKTALKKRTQAFFDNMTEEQKYIIELDYNVINRCGGLDAGRVDDPKLKQIVELCTDKAMYKSFLSLYNNNRQLAYKLGLISYSDYYHDKRQSGEVHEHLKLYPLLRETHDSFAGEHIYLYCNYIYNQFYKDKEEK